MIAAEAPNRRIVVKFIAAGAAVALFRPIALLAAPLVDLGEDRYSSWADKARNIYFIEGLDFVVDQSAIPANSSVFVRGDHVTLSGTLSLPGSNFTLYARKLICSSGAGISTHGKIGKNDYAGLTAPIGKDGANDAGPGTDGGTITIVVGEMEGALQLDAGGGNGASAQSGGDGAAGSPGASADHQHDGQPGSAGHLGGLAGKPGNGGNGGAIFVGAIQGLPKNGISIAQAGGLPGKPGHNGKSGHGAPGGQAASGTDDIWGHCPIR